MQKTVMKINYEMPELFVPRLMKILADKHIAPKTFSREMGCSINTAYEWIYGYRTPRVNNYMAICKYLNVDPRYLWGLVDEMGHYE